MAGTISIAILANAAQAKREFGDVADVADRSTGRLKGSIGKVGKLLAVGLGAGLIGAAAAGTKFAQAAIEDEKSASKMAQTFTKAAGATKQQISATESWITAQGKAFGVADDDLRPALSRLVTSTKDVGEAQKLTSLAMDISAGTGKSLESVSTALMKANNGQVSSLSRLGINTKNAAGETISMEQATKRMADTFGGAAAANANTLGGKVDRLKLVASEAGETIGAKMLPTLTTFAGFLLAKVVPAVIEIGGRIKEWVQEMAARLAPTISVVAGFVTGTLVPALLKFGGYITGTVAPAVVAFATKIGANLRPVLEAVVQVVQKVAAKFREWQPEITTTVAVIGKIIAKVLEFSTKITGVVLPVVIKFAGILLSTLIPVVVTVVSTVAKVIAKVIDFGGAVIDGAKKVGEFASKINDKVQDVLGYFADLPAKIKSHLSGAGTMLTEIGKNILQGLINGLDAAKQWVIDKIQAITDSIPNWVKKRLGIASPSKVLTRLGEFAGQGLADGLANSRETVAKEADKTGKKIVERIKKQLDGAKGIRDSITSMRDSVRDSLTGDLFGGVGDEESTALDKFRTQLDGAKTKAAEVAAAVRKLIDAKVGNGFLQNLLSSGNTELIVQLAGAPDLASLSASYQTVVEANEETGRLVAEQVIGTRLDTINTTIKGLLTRLDERDERDRKDKRSVSVRLTSEQRSQLERGRELRMDLDLWDSTGGRVSA